jgi:putative transposase
MRENNEIKHGRHCVFNRYLYLVFVAKYRREVFTKEIFETLRPIFSSVCRNFEAERVEFKYTKKAMGRRAVVS